jgi:prevent-host-death family protein
MIKVNISEAKVHLSRYIKAAKAGERVILCDRNVPVMELVPINHDHTRPVARTFGRHRGQIKVAENFGQWDEEMERLFMGDAAGK